MPQGLPPVEMLANRRLQAFTLDTSVIEAAGFRVASGPIRHLSAQLPPWMQLWMSDVVLREIDAHRGGCVEKGLQQIRSGIQELQRHIGDDFQTGNMRWMEGVPHVARDTFERQMSQFIKAHSGVVVDVSHPSLARLMFERYFSHSPPFGGGKDKKHEFPDAAVLLALELKAQDLDYGLIAVSKDVGWASYAASSKRIYCVNDVQELAALYVSTSPLARDLRQSLTKTLEVPNSALRRRLEDVIQKGLQKLPWLIRVPRTHHFEIDAGVIDARLVTMEPNSAAVGVWITSQREDSCVVELGIDVSVNLAIEAVAYEVFRSGEKNDLAFTEIAVEHRCEVKLVLEMQGDLKSPDPWQQVTNIELRPAPIPVVVDHLDFGGEIGEVPGLHGGWSSIDDPDDIPF